MEEDTKKVEEKHTRGGVAPAVLLFLVLLVFLLIAATFSSHTCSFVTGIWFSFSFCAKMVKMSHEKEKIEKLLGL